MVETLSGYTLAGDYSAGSKQLSVFADARPKEEAQNKLREIVAKQSITSAVGNGGSLLRRSLMDYRPARVDGKRAATKRWYAQALDYYILPELGTSRWPTSRNLPLFLTRLANKRSNTIVQQCRYHIRAIFDEAVDAEWIYKNPAHKLAMPDRKEPDQPYMENEEFLKLCDELPGLKDWLIVNVCRFGGLRTQ